MMLLHSILIVLHQYDLYKRVGYKYIFNYTFNILISLYASIDLLWRAVVKFSMTLLM